jgi:hypothetical protein
LSQLVVTRVPETLRSTPNRPPDGRFEEGTRLRSYADETPGTGSVVASDPTDTEADVYVW